MKQTLLPGMGRRLDPRPPGWEPDALEPIPSSVRELAVDFETTGLRWWAGDRPCGVAVSWRDPTGPLRERYFPFGHLDGNLPEERVLDWCRTELKGRRVVNLNTKFDAHHAREWGVDLAEICSSLGDVAHYAGLLDDQRGKRTKWNHPFSLEAIGQDYVGAGKVEGLDLSDGAHVYPAWQLTPYGRQDAGLVIRILEAQRPQLEAEELQAVAALEDAIIPVVLEMEKNAAPIDVEKLALWVKETEAELNMLHMKLARMAGRRVNPGSPNDMDRLFAERGLSTGEFTPTGRPSYTGAALERLAKTDEVVAMLVKINHLADLRSRYLLPYLEAAQGTGRLRFEFHQLKGDEYGTVSGRFSSSKPIGAKTGANVQQVMSVEKHLRYFGKRWVVRELFIPDSGLFFSSDAKQIEYRIFAHLSDSPRLIKAYIDDPDTDFHEWTGAIVRKLRPDFERKRLKTINFMSLFGGGADTTSEKMGVSRAEGQELQNHYHQAFPEAKRLLRKAERVAQRRGYVKTFLGRRARFPKLERLYAALNRAVQGGAADYNKLALVALYAERKALGLTLRMTVHDEVDGDVPDQAAADAVDAVLNRQHAELKVPILWDSNTGPHWAACDKEWRKA